MKEEWRDISDWEGSYRISNLGRFYSVPRIALRRNKKPLPVKGGYLKGSCNGRGKGYLQVRLGKKQVYIHRLVAIYFLKKEEGLDFVNHIDGDTKNNKVSNLEWCTRSQNLKHAFRTGLIKTPYIGDTSRNLKLNTTKVLEIKRLLKQGVFHKDIAIMYNVSKATITDINLKRSWGHLDSYED